MTRALILIAGVGFIMAVACLGGAAALGGGQLAQHGWDLHNARLTIDDDKADQKVGIGWGPPSNLDGGGPPATREIAWGGGDALDVDIPAEVRFTQAAGPGRLTITGPKGTVDQIRLTGSDLDFNEEPAEARRVVIVMTAPDVRHFTLDGDVRLSVAGFDQDRLDLQLNGDDQAEVKGRARAASVDISGDGEADLAALDVDEAEVRIEGSGRSTIAPRRRADLTISGDGEIDLTTHPADMHSDVSGSGRIVQGAAAAISPPR